MTGAPRVSPMDGISVHRSMRAVVAALSEQEQWGNFRLEDDASEDEVDSEIS